MNSAVKIFLVTVFLLVQQGWAHSMAHSMAHNYELTMGSIQPILADLRDLKDLGVKPLYENKKAGVGYVEASAHLQMQLSLLAHKKGKCGGFESLEAFAQSRSLNSMQLKEQAVPQILNDIAQLNERNEIYSKAPYKLLSVGYRSDIGSAINEVSAANLQKYVEWLSAFPNRYNKDSLPNKHVEALVPQLQNILSTGSLKYQIDLIDHKSTKQKTIRVHIPGTLRPQEIIVMGGHLDSINQEWFGGGGRVAPGADDNASGSSNLIEALRIISKMSQPERTIELFWYAGEESGLLGSAEIAQSYKSAKKDVVAVLQLDMTLMPGAGELVVGNISDFTTAWLRNYLEEINKTYQLGIRFIDDQCGYGCSDHASWYRHGYATVIPFEADTQRMNKFIHTTKDVVGPQSNFNHSAVFAKMAIIFALDLGNSSARPIF